MEPTEIQLSPELRTRISHAAEHALLKHTGSTKIPITKSRKHKIYADKDSLNVTIKNPHLMRSLVEGMDAALCPYSGNEDAQKEYCGEIADSKLRAEAGALRDALLHMQNATGSPVCVLRGISDDPMLVSVVAQTLGRLNESGLIREGEEVAISNLPSSGVVQSIGENVEGHANQTLHIDFPLENPAYEDLMKAGTTRALACEYQSSNPLSTQFLLAEDAIEQCCAIIEAKLTTQEKLTIKPFLLEALQTPIWGDDQATIYANQHPKRGDEAPQYGLSISSPIPYLAEPDAIDMVAKKHGFTLDRANELIRDLRCAWLEVERLPQKAAHVFLEPGDIVFWNDLAVLHSAGKFQHAGGNKDNSKRLMHEATGQGIALDDATYSRVNHFPHTCIESPSDYFERVSNAPENAKDGLDR